MGTQLLEVILIICTGLVYIVVFRHGSSSKEESQLTPFLRGLMVKSACFLQPLVQRAWVQISPRNITKSKPNGL